MLYRVQIKYSIVPKVDDVMYKGGKIQNSLGFCGFDFTTKAVRLCVVLHM